MFPPSSRGGIVRRPSAASGGTAASGSGSATGWPRSRSCSSRVRNASIRSCDGATPTTPANISSGTVTPGSSSDQAMPSAMSHLTTYGSVNRSARKPNPGITAVTPKSADSYETNSTSRV